MTSKKPRRQPRPSLLKESGLLQRARQFLKERFPGQEPHLVVGYSGGRDSLALLLVFRELDRLGACRVTAAHVDHRLRPDSAEAAERALKVAGDLGIPCVLKVAPESLRKAFPGQSVEDVARRFRYQQLTRVVEEAGADVIAVGHHRGDQVETVLLHILRGSGLAGLRGMLPDSLLAVTWLQKPGSGPATKVRVIRPFLHEPPEVLHELVAGSGLPVIDDPTNAEPDFRRNRIRHELLPLMEDIAPGAAGRIAALANLAHEDDQALENVSLLFLDRSLDGDTLQWEALRGAPLGLRRRVVRQWLLRFAEVDELSLDRVDAVIELASRGQGGKRVDVGDGWLVRFGRGQLDIVPPGRNR
jgi:tRNA(Ile)-lysidine synthase